MKVSALQNFTAKLLLLGIYILLNIIISNFNKITNRSPTTLAVWSGLITSSQWQPCPGPGLKLRLCVVNSVSIYLRYNV